MDDADSSAADAGTAARSIAPEGAVVAISASVSEDTMKRLDALGTRPGGPAIPRDVVLRLVIAAGLAYWEHVESHGDHEVSQTIPRLV